ncbi:hypothetical protein MNB_SV-15-1134 [hydrothermal vent metagenome]|uniref:DUF177 domain-containing protein n=1 Tax=hydrothermal vent metagenome TaxID=652676 RepID=A0A1W1EL11_9ZZZZ
MKMPFDKINNFGKEFEYKSDLMPISLNGKVTKIGYHRVSIEGNLKGSLEVDCARCGVEINRDIDENLKFTISDQFIETTDDLDIIEFIDGIIDIEYIVNSEINSLKSSYNYCPKCEDLDDDFEMEF